MKIKLLFFSLVLLAMGGSLFAQQLIFPVAGVVTVDALPAKAPYEVFVNATITSVVFTNPVPGQLITVLFLQDSTGHSVTFGGNILNACSVSTTANALTSCQFQYDARTVQWTGLGGGSSSSPGVFSASADPPMTRCWSGATGCQAAITTTGRQTAVNLTAAPIDTHTIQWRPSGTVTTC